MTEKKVRSKGSKLISYMKKVRDFYVRGMIAWSGHMTYADAAIGCPTGNLSTIPRSFSAQNSATRSRDHEFKDLIRASATSLKSPRNGAAAIKLPRSRSIAIGRIDEDRPCEFEIDDIVKVKPLFYRRCRSYAILRSDFDK